MLDNDSGPAAVVDDDHACVAGLLGGAEAASELAVDAFLITVAFWLDALAELAA
jgi:hypothetical protein